MYTVAAKHLPGNAENMEKATGSSDGIYVYGRLAPFPQYTVNF